MKQYDIFISYRRSSYDTANLIATRLKAVGYSVFFDMETLRAGKFNEQLFGVIENCKDFVVVLPPSALDRCVNEDDWVRLEVSHAMAHNKNIIPVMLNGFVWPEPMPQGMEELRNYQALTASSIEYFDLAMERLQQRYLVSKRHFPFQRLWKTLGGCIIGLAVIVAILWGVFMFLSRDVCSNYATRLVSDASGVHIIATENKALQKDWNSFIAALSHEKRSDRIRYLQQDMMSRIDLAERNIKSTWRVDSVKMKVSDYHSFLLSMHGINSQEISISPVFATQYYTDYFEQLKIVRNAVNNPNTLNIRYATVLFEVSEHSINSYYIALLSELSTFPENSLTIFKEFLPYWIHFPKLQYKLGEEDRFYEDAMNTENKYIEELLSRYESIVEEADAELNDISHKNDVLEEQMNEGFAQLQAQANSIKGKLEIEKIRKRNEKELAIRQEKLNAKEITVEASKAELEELDKQYVLAYENLKKKCTLEESDDQWYQWGKIRRWGSFLTMVVDSRQHLKAQNIYSTSFITPEVIYADMSAQLTVYQTYHPESKEYVAASKAFFKDVSKGRRKCAGVIVFAFKDEAIHPFLKKGDIIVGYNGKTIVLYDDFKAVYKNSKLGVVEVLRLVDGQFEELEFPQMENTEIVGFLDLVESL